MADYVSEVAKGEETNLQDAVTTGVDQPSTKQDSADEKEQRMVRLWLQRFRRAERYRAAHIDRMMRMYKLYRAYRDAHNYAYGTNIMPPIGFEIVETVKPRLASADMSITVQPTRKDDINSEFLGEWDGLIEYNLSVLGDQTGFDDLKILWINAMLIYGNGIVQVSWNGDHNGQAYAEVVDNFMLYVDPQATNRMLDSRWEIKQHFKSKAVVVAEEKKRGDMALYDANALDALEDKPVLLDPRIDRTNLVTLRMGQINDGVARGQATDSGPGTEQSDKNSQEASLELWECWDHVTNKLIVIANREKVIRNDDNPYIAVRNGRMFIDMPDISLNWEFYAMSHLDPVETTIYEIADSRNQAMDDIVFTLDPIRKIKKGKGYKPDDLKHSPGAVWELDNVNDVVIQTGPGISNSWVEKDSMLRQSIQTALALSEYTQGIPQNAQEPSSKVEMLLAQTNIRFSLLVRQMEIAFTDLVNTIIELNQEFLSDQKEYRITGTKTVFRTFGMDAKSINVDATVSINPKPEKSPDQIASETVGLYKALVTDDLPLVLKSNDPAEISDFKRKKRVMQKLLIEAFGRGQYLKEIMGPEPTTNETKPPAPALPPTPQPKKQTPAPQPQPPQKPIPVIAPEQAGKPAANSNAKAFLARLIGGMKK